MTAIRTEQLGEMDQDGRVPPSVSPGSRPSEDAASRRPGGAASIPSRTRGTVSILYGDCREVLRSLPAESVHCVVTSPPYFGLRSYLPEGHPDKALEIGLEETPESFVAGLVQVFREVRRVLRSDGTLWLNLGDSYAGARAGAQGVNGQMADRSVAAARCRVRGETRVAPGLKPKDLIGIPWRVAFALQADGWWLRSDIIWHKPNPMPESITDRPTSAHEHIFLLSKSERYFYDADAVKQAVAVPGWDDGTRVFGDKNKHGANAQHGYRTTRRLAVSADRKALPNETYSRHRAGIEGGQSLQAEPDGLRNLRNVWTVATCPFPDTHYATFPPSLIVDCIKAGCPVGGTVFDPFGGAGTTGLVAARLGRDAVLIELDERSVAMAERRIAADSASPVERARIRHAHKPVEHGPLFAGAEGC